MVAIPTPRTTRRCRSASAPWSGPITFAMARPRESVPASCAGIVTYLMIAGFRRHDRIHVEQSRAADGRANRVSMGLRAPVQLARGGQGVDPRHARTDRRPESDRIRARNFPEGLSGDDRPDPRRAALAEKALGW